MIFFSTWLPELLLKRKNEGLLDIYDVISETTYQNDLYSPDVAMKTGKDNKFVLTEASVVSPYQETPHLPSQLHDSFHFQSPLQSTTLPLQQPQHPSQQPQRQPLQQQLYLSQNLTQHCKKSFHPTSDVARQFDDCHSYTPLQAPSPHEGLHPSSPPNLPQLSSVPCPPTSSHHLLSLPVTSFHQTSFPLPPTDNPDGYITAIAWWTNSNSYIPG